MQLRRRTALALLLLAACGAPPQAELQAELQALPVDAEGSWIRHRRVRLAPAHTKGFEAVLATCVNRASSEVALEPEECTLDAQIPICADDLALEPAEPTVPVATTGALAQ